LQQSKFSFSKPLEEEGGVKKGVALRADFRGEPHAKADTKRSKGKFRYKLSTPLWQAGHKAHKKKERKKKRKQSASIIE